MQGCAFLRLAAALITLSEWSVAFAIAEEFPAPLRRAENEEKLIFQPTDSERISPRVTIPFACQFGLLSIGRRLKDSLWRVSLLPPSTFYRGRSL